MWDCVIAMKNCCVPFLDDVNKCLAFNEDCVPWFYYLVRYRSSYLVSCLVTVVPCLLCLNLTQSCVKIMRVSEVTISLENS
jgi:hypothetical protein